jgi:hypothetical protein
MDGHEVEVVVIASKDSSLLAEFAITYYYEIKWMLVDISVMRTCSASDRV